MGMMGGAANYGISMGSRRRRPTAGPGLETPPPAPIEAPMAAPPMMADGPAPSDWPTGGVPPPAAPPPSLFGPAQPMAQPMARPGAQNLYEYMQHQQAQPLSGGAPPTAQGGPQMGMQDVMRRLLMMLHGRR